MDFVAYADTSIPAIYALRSPINAEAQIAKVPPCALAAIVDNESEGRNVLQEGMQPGPGAGVGLCQITAGVDWSDLAHPKFHGYDLWNEADNLYVAAAYFLAPAIQSALRLQRDDPTGFARFGDGQVLFYAFAAYNAGFGAVLARYNAGENPDDSTTNGYAARGLAAYNDFVSGSHKALVGL
jgi:hypothetical protein